MSTPRKPARAARERRPRRPARSEAARHRAYRASNGTRVEYRAGVLLTSARKRARDAGLPFNLTKAWIVDKLRAGACEATGLPLCLERSGDRVAPLAPSLDQRVPRAGYTTENARVVAMIWNFLKGEWADEQAAFIVIGIADNLHRGVVGGVCEEQRLTRTSRPARARRKPCKCNPTQRRASTTRKHK
jgi:hypothetical protein